VFGSLKLNLCEAACPTLAIAHRFEIVAACIEDQQKTPSNSTKVVEGNKGME